VGAVKDLSTIQSQFQVLYIDKHIMPRSFT
jgi:hypothetical protein